MTETPWPARAMQSPDAGSRRVVIAVRAAVVALCATLCLALGVLPDLGGRLLLLVLLALVMSLAPVGPGWSVWLPVAEGALAAVVTSWGSTDPTPLLPYLVVAPVAAGVLSGFPATFAAAFATGVALVAVREPETVADKAELAEWVALGLAIGLLGAWARWAAHEAASRAGSYAAANRLLVELRDVARALPSGLDEVSLAQAAMDEVGSRLEFDRGTLFTRSDSGYLMPLAIVGADRVDWDPDVGQLWGRAWATSRPVQAPGQFSDPSGGHRVVAPLRLGERAVGLVALERDGGTWSRDELAALGLVANEAAMRIDTGHMFSDLRALATVEERRRVAREIHDGVAQEVAGLGFLVDDMAARSTDEVLRGDLVDLRSQLTRIVSELRLSIFDLRSDVEPATGLGAALGSYVRQVGTGSGLTVHLVLDEAASRLLVETETELLRIAQEAITNARKHSRARNLWVTCRVDPPRAFLRVADDGRGLGLPRNDSYGLDIMRERAARLGASLSVRNRVGGGTVIEVSLSGASVRGEPAPARGRGTT